MASKRQLEANRANARRSTGPRTPQGKASSSKNALSHGLAARLELMADEDPAEYDALREGLEADFQVSRELAPPQNVESQVRH